MKDSGNYFMPAKFTHILFLIVFMNTGTVAQNINKLEQEYDSIKIELAKDKQKLDSLTTVLNKRATLIDTEKEKSDVDNNKVVRLMAQSVVISNQIERQQKRLTLTRKKFEAQRKMVLNRYNVIIDSLQSVRTEQKNQESIERSILKYTEKKLSVSPKIKSLSYDPEKILQIDLSTIEDISERSIYEQYLQRALVEVDSQLHDVQNLTSEVEAILRLQGKAQNFIDEIEMDTKIGPYLVVSDDYDTKDAEVLSENWRVGDIENLSDIDSYIVLLRQLELMHPTEYLARWQSVTDSVAVNLSLRDYQELLQEIAQKLQDYRTVLAKKITPVE
jgi:hypothetical protein